MEINYELKPEDFYQFGKENARAQSDYQPTVFLYGALYLMFIFADVIYLLLTGWENWNLRMLLASIFVRSIFCFLSVFAAIWMVKALANKKLKKLMEEQAKNGLFCEHRIILTEKALIELTDVNTSRYAWKSIGEIRELESFVLIEVLMSSTYIVPKRYFENRSRVVNFIETANQHRQNAESNFQLSHFIEYEKGLE